MRRDRGEEMRGGEQKRGEEKRGEERRKDRRKGGYRKDQLEKDTEKRTERGPDIVQIRDFRNLSAWAIFRDFAEKV